MEQQKERTGPGLWAKTDRNGGTYWMGKHDGKVYFLRKSRSENPNAPEFQLNIEGERKPADDADF